MKNGEGEGWIRDPLGGDLDTFWAACPLEDFALSRVTPGILSRTKSLLIASICKRSG